MNRFYYYTSVDDKIIAMIIVSAKSEEDSIGLLNERFKNAEEPVQLTFAEQKP